MGAGTSFPTEHYNYSIFKTDLNSVLNKISLFFQKKRHNPPITS